MRVGDQPETRAVDDDLAGLGVRTAQLDVGRARRAASRIDRDAEPVRRDPGDVHPVAGAAQFEVDRLVGVQPDLRAAAVRGRQEPLPGDVLGVLVRLDRGGGQRHRRAAVPDEPPLGADPVDPAGVRGRVDHLGLVQQVEHEALVRRAACDDHRGLRHRAAQPAKRLVAVPPEGNDLGDHRVEVGRDGIALADARVHPDTRAGRQVQPDDAARRGGEVTVRVLGVQPRLDGVSGLGGRRALQPAARGDTQLELHQIHPGGGLGDRVLHLQPGVHLKEREPPLAGVVQELHGARAPVADRQRQPLGGGLQLGGLLRGQYR